MNLYRQSIVIFGLVLPLGVVGAALFASLLLKSNIESRYQKNIIGFKESETSRLAGLAVEGKLITQRPAMERWTKLLSGETANIVSVQLREILASVDQTELQQTNFEPSSLKSGFGAVTAQKSSQLDIDFRGTYRAMQRCLLELETRLPQLQLQGIKVDPIQGQRSLLNFKITYTAWEY